MLVDVLLGLQWGDEGKGKVVDFLADQYDIVCRFQGGPNAGHTLYIKGKKTVLHTIPSGIFRPGIANLIGNGVVIDPTTLMKEIAEVRSMGVDIKKQLLISKRAHLILPTHKVLDAASEAAKGIMKIGSTLRGIGPTYMDKTGRNGLRIGDILRADFEQRYKALKEKHIGLLRLYPEATFDIEREEAEWLESIAQLRQFQIVDGEYFINEALAHGKRVLAEGAQGTMLDIDFGTYPYVTSSNTISAGVCNGLGVAPTKIGKVIGITKAYCTRVGSGPFPTELHDAAGEKLRELGHEFGATTGRPRRCGWIDIPQLRYTMMINGVTDIALTKVDVLTSFDKIGVGTGYQIGEHFTDKLPFDLEDDQISPHYDYLTGWSDDITQVQDFNALPNETQSYIENLEEMLETPITFVSTGPQRDALITRDALIGASQL